jgi:signal transduction histidine kinase
MTYSGDSCDPSARLLEQMRVINRIGSALSQSLVLDDIETLLLSALVSERGLGCSRAILMTFDERTARLEGKRACGPMTRREAETSERQARAEEEALDSIRARMGAPSDAVVDDDSDLAEALADLKASAVWIAAFQSAGDSSKLTRRVRTVAWPCAVERLEADDPRRRPILERRAVLCERAACAASLPEVLREVLDDTFLIVPVVTRRGLRALALADRRFRSRPFARSEMRLFEWFCSQASMAWENAELFGSLNEALSELQELDRLKSGFLSIISHELRTPLTAMLGFCELVLDERVGPVAPRQADLLRRAIHRGGLLSDMIDDLLEIEEIETGSLADLEVEEVDPLAAFMSAARRVEPRRADKGIEIETDLSQGAPPPIRSNRRALERILFHLLDNAVKFSPPASRVRAAFALETDRLRVTIADRGIGIAPEVRSRIFEPFCQVDQRLTRRHDGIGIGLTLTRKLLDMLGGRIEVESEQGQGSLFTLLLPSPGPPPATLILQDDAE